MRVSRATKGKLMKIKASAPSIVCTSLVGAKGLSAEHVFIVGFVNEEFPKDPSAPTDDEVCQLIVGLSRTRKACHLISCGRWAGVPKKESEFLEWLGDIAVEDRYISKDYWSD
jgi:superfamily I DNA/RNA helicase